MPTVVWKAIRTRNAYFDVPGIKRYIIDGLLDDVAPMIIREHQMIVIDWAGKPDFEAHAFVHADALGIAVRPRGPVAKIWHWLSRGVAGHMIYPRRKKALRFAPRGGFGPVLPSGPTRVGWSWSPSGTWAFSKGHWWPGILPRGFEQRIVAKVKPVFRRIAENILRRAMRRARRRSY